MISVEEALERILNEIRPLGLERIPVTEALGRVLGEDLYSTRLIPPEDNSAMDGYALRSEDTAGAREDSPRPLKVIGDLPAGSTFEGRVEEGEAVRIMTGAPIPEGADAVIMKEYTRSGEGVVEVLKGVCKGENIRKAGEDVKPGDLVIPEGTLISPSEMGMMAALGRAFVPVYQRPRVSILSTGDELIEPGEVYKEGKIVNSNGYSLYGEVLSTGSIPVYIGIAKDSRESLRDKLTLALNGGDVVITSGGVSVGDYDFVKDVLKELEGEMRFWKVAIKPGKPLAFGKVKGKPVFGLPGNPVSSMVAFEEFVRPALLKMMGMRDIYRRVIEVTLGEDIEKKPGRRHFIQAILKYRDGTIYAYPLRERGSGILSSLVKADGLIVIDEDITEVKAGSRVRFQIIKERFLHQEVQGY